MSMREEGRALQAIDYNQAGPGYFKLTALKSSGTKFSLSLPGSRLRQANCPDDEMEELRSQPNLSLDVTSTHFLCYLNHKDQTRPVGRARLVSNLT